jgi:hypothetical protein
MTATILQSELSSLIQDSKRKSPDIRNAAEKSLGELKSISITSEAQLAGDLLRRPHFVDPFILACQSRNAKFASSAVVCLQRLAASRALPRERLQDVVDAFQEVTSSGLDVQLKILQTLPSLLQIYAQDVEGNLLAAILGVCGDLQDNRTAVVSSTATATFQQLITTVYEKVSQEDALADISVVENLKFGDTTIGIGQASYDAYRIFNDLCAFANGAQLDFLRIKSVSVTFIMELIDGILQNSTVVFQHHPEQVEACRVYLVPAVMKILSTKQNFALNVRALRILYVLLARHASQMAEELDAAFQLVMRGLDPSSGPLWKRVLHIEFLNRICLDARLLRQLFSLFDQQESRSSFVGSVMAAFVRIASEKPTLIGIGHQSTVPFRRGGNEDSNEGLASLEATGVTGMITATASADSNVTGISIEWSTVKTPYLEQLDKTDVLEPPSTYVYGLVLNSVAAFSESLAKYIMPLSIQFKSQALRQQRDEKNNGEEMDEGGEGAELARTESIAAARSTSGKYNMLTNPLKLANHPQLEDVKVCAAMIEECWPAFLAACSTFLNAALDADFYHTIVRAFQKLTQVAGVLELTTPRDAMLTTLAKAAVPTGSMVVSAPGVVSKAQPRATSVAEVPQDTESEQSGEVDQRSTLGTPRRSHEQDRQSITTRNLLCLRALINLGIALGGTLNADSWFTILETLQQAERVIEISNKVLAQQGTKDANNTTNSLVSRASLGSEISAVQTASRRMFEGTANYSNKSFSNILLALIRFSGTPISTTTQDASALSPVPNTPTTPQRGGRMHQYSRSFSVSYSKPGPEQEEVQFFLSHMSDIARLNLPRLVSEPPTQSGWRLIFQSIFHIIRLTEGPSSLRLQSTALLNRIVVECMKALSEDDSTKTTEVQLRCLDILRSQYEMLYREPVVKAEGATLDVEIHIRCLEALHSMLEACNSITQSGWKLILQLVCSPYSSEHPARGVHNLPGVDHTILNAKSPKLVQPSFGCLQLIGSDFLAALSMSDLAVFIDALWVFARQRDDLNIALTSTSFFWNVALYLQVQIGEWKMSWEEMEVNEAVILNHISEASGEGRLTAVWILLVMRLMRMTNDSREDVRSSSFRIVVRVLDLFGDKISAALWIACLELSVQAMSNPLQQATLDASLGWETSLIMMTEGTIDLLVRHSETVTLEERFPKLMQHIFEIFNGLLRLESHLVASVVYTGTCNLLAVLSSRKDLHDRSASAALELWQARHPADIAITSTAIVSTVSKPVRPTKEDNQKALTQHADVFLKLRELFPQQLMSLLDTSAVMGSMRKTIFNCVHPQYTSDVNKPSSEQERVIAMLPVLHEKMSTKQDEFVQFLLGFGRAALLSAKPTVEDEPARPMNQRGPQSPTFVAFSSKCIDILEAVVSKETFSDSSVVDTLYTFSEIIKSKYTSTPQGTDPVLWRNATTKAISMVEVVIPTNSTTISAHSDKLHSFLGAVVNVAMSILGSGGLQDLEMLVADAQILSDEEFDMESFQCLHKIISPNMAIWYGSSQKLRETCRRYMLLLLQTSFICAPFYGDLPQGLQKSPLDKLLNIRAGTVCPPVSPTRLKIPYVALNTLFDLVTQPKNTANPCHSLAYAAAPYLLLRCAWALKTFIADQPLRSLSPLPTVLCHDLYVIITMCLQTRTFDDAFTRESLFEGVSSGSKDDGSLRTGGERHLQLLYPLVLKFLAVWRRVPRLNGGGDWMEKDEARRIERGLDEWLSVVGRGWELDGAE